ncbi:imidazole glycerol phosphate synthase subunit HisH [Terricaulis silvestris]|uniref:Imidazole glycerol phosphate synthase subunit HisH n=1 Tax=Terricaulis silvestris TaxID=2686094 RepID=A0A6I6MH05_9CAUL|nr:imidazole glycerol phosphate synthase subunit HisH [Terricaulis silvestris]QGZ93629.1 Imidazole glycerol phosphate synthase subunit HisH [Terricaulis silvestris]
MDVAVIKLGVGNTASVMFALERVGANATLTNDPTQVRDAARVILPGVGAAAAAMRLLNQSGMAEVLRTFARPLLGICLGQQVLYDRSEEGSAAGLGLLPGTVAALEATPQRPAPHMGWSALRIEQHHALLEGVRSGDYAYFVHSYACPADANAIAQAEYGAVFAAAVARDNVFGCQFHPERSGAVGARILRNFLALPC